jgi:hypothetical protein
MQIPPIQIFADDIMTCEFCEISISINYCILGKMARLVAVMIAVRALASQRSRATAVHHPLGIGALPRCAHAASLLCLFFGHRAFWSVPLRTGLNVRVTTGQTPGPVTSTPSAVASTSPGYGPYPICPSIMRVCLSSSPIPTHISATIRACLPGIMSTSTELSRLS